MLICQFAKRGLTFYFSFLRLRMLFRVWLTLKKWQRFNVHYSVFVSAAKYLSRKLCRDYLWRPKYQRRRGRKFERKKWAKNPVTPIFVGPSPKMSNEWRTRIGEWGKNRVMAKSWSKHQGTAKIFFCNHSIQKIFEFGASLTKSFVKNEKKSAIDRACPSANHGTKYRKHPRFAIEIESSKVTPKRSRSYWRAVESSFSPFLQTKDFDALHDCSDGS